MDFDDGPYDLAWHYGRAQEKVDRLTTMIDNLSNHERWNQLEAEVARLRKVLERIVADADESPMEDLLSAGEIARDALKL